jgi:medium-chain acyl-[acyl-carrier-protein] hydrolase
MFEKQFELRYFEMNKHGEASATTMLTLLEETASDHCSAIGHGLFDLFAKNIGWILVSGFMQIDRYPKHKEKITIKTWLSSYSTVKGFRENIIYDAQNNIIGRAKGLWLFFDIEKRKPIEILEDIKQQWQFYPEESIAKNIVAKIPAINNAKYIEEFSVHRFDIDMNNHVNNIKYLHWVMESMPAEILDNYYLHSIDGRFLQEANLGDTLISYTENRDSETEFVHTIKIKESEKVCATARTVWVKRFTS